MRAIKRKGQALAEMLIMMAVLTTVLAGTYVTGKILSTKQSSEIFARALAFKDTYGKNRALISEIKDYATKDTNAYFVLEKSRSTKGSGGGIAGFLEKIFNFLSSTKVSKIRGSYDLENYLMKSIESSRNVKIKNELYMDEGTFSHNAKLRLLLYGIAFAKAGFARDTKLEDIGQDYLNEADVLEEKENMVFE